LINPSVSPYELSTPLLGARFNILIINDNIDSPLGYLLPSLKRKVEIPGNLLLKYKWDQCHNARGVVIHYREGGKSMKKYSAFRLEANFRDLLAAKRWLIPPKHWYLPVNYI